MTFDTDNSLITDPIDSRIIRASEKAHARVELSEKVAELKQDYHSLFDSQIPFINKTVIAGFLIPFGLLNISWSVLGYWGLGLKDRAITHTERVAF